MAPPPPMKVSLYVAFSGDTKNYGQEDVQTAEQTASDHNMIWKFGCIRTYLIKQRIQHTGTENLTSSERKTKYMTQVGCHTRL